MNVFSGIHLGRGSLLALTLLAAACGREQSMASKSAAAYREAVKKGETVGGGHEHGGHATATAATVASDGKTLSTTAQEHAGHDMTGASADTGDEKTHASEADHAAMGHDTKGRAAAGHRTGVAHGEHKPPTSGGAHDQHAGMDHGPTPKTPDPHAQHRQPSAAPQPLTDHSQHGARTPSPAATTDAHAQHRQPSTAPQPQTGHLQHGATPPAPAAATDPHAQHRATGSAAAPVAASAPRTNAEIRSTQPASTLRPDAFDTPAPVSVSEAAKATQGGEHAGHEQRGITPGQDRENPPTPMPATRDGGSPSAIDHSGHDAHTKPAAAMYACPIHPEVTSDKPGTCPKCGRALVEKK